MTTSTCSASDTGLPIPMPILARPTPRRGFLAGLATLPLIGGGVALLGRPTGVAEPITPHLLEAYKTWLERERRALSWEMSIHPLLDGFYSGATRSERFDNIDRTIMYVGASGSFHTFCDRTSAAPSRRAALVLSTVGCDWHERED